MFCLARHFLMAQVVLTLGPHLFMSRWMYWLLTLNRMSSFTRHSGLKDAGGTIRHSPKRSASGLIFSMYSSGSLNSSTEGKKEGALVSRLFSLIRGGAASAMRGSGCHDEVPPEPLMVVVLLLELPVPPLALRCNLRITR